MPQAKSDAGDDNRRFYIVLFHGPEKKSAENYFLCEPHAEHAEDEATNISNGYAVLPMRRAGKYILGKGIMGLFWG